MSYNQYSTLVYGIQLTDQQTRKVDEYIQNKLLPLVSPPPNIQEQGLGYCLLLIGLPEVQMNTHGDEYDEAIMEWATPEQLNTMDCSCAFGIVVKSFDDQRDSAGLVKAIAKGPSKTTVNQWDSKIAPVLKSLEINKKPSLHVISQAG